MANYTYDFKCLTCNVELHLTGLSSYVSLEANRFSNLHQGHNVIPLPHEPNTAGKDSGTNCQNKLL
jgi:hypothetical protein